MFYMSAQPVVVITNDETNDTGFVWAEYIMLQMKQFRMVLCKFLKFKMWWMNYIILILMYVIFLPLQKDQFILNLYWGTHKKFQINLSRRNRSNFKKA